MIKIKQMRKLRGRYRFRRYQQMKINNMIKIKPEEEKYMESSPVTGYPKKGKEPVKIYPRLRLEHKFFPEVKKWEVGKTYKVELELKMTGLSISKFQNDSEFDITGFDDESGEPAEDEGKE